MPEPLDDVLTMCCRVVPRVMIERPIIMAMRTVSLVKSHGYDVDEA